MAGPNMEANGPSTSQTDAVLAELMPSDEDLLYEEEILRNPFSLRMWWRYISARKDATAKRRYLLYERALKALPGSYKLWHTYLNERRIAVRGLSISHPGVESLNNTYERALVSMHKMPRIWLDYIALLMEQGFITRTRRTLDRALTSLPVTQHDRIWVLYLQFATQAAVPMDTAFRVYRRYLRLEPNHREEYIVYLKAKERWGEAARQLADIVNDDTFRSLEGKSKHNLWLELCDLITKHPDQVRDLNVDAIIRSGIRKFTNEVGRLWTALADYYIRRGLFERARDVYEEGIQSVTTVRDFSLIFDAFVQFEESLATAKMAQLGQDEDEAPPVEGDGSDFLLTDDGNDIDLRLSRLEWLMSRRPELLSSVMLRQNPHNVQEWHKRVQIFKEDPRRQVLTYTEAVKTVDAGKATGKLHSLWCAFAHFYDKHGDISNARIVFRKATQVAYTYTDDLAHVWCQWAEMELKHQNFQKAIQLLAEAVAEPNSAKRRLTSAEQQALPPQEKLYRNQRVWSLYIDLVESLGTLEETRAVYDQMLELKVASTQTILNYALYLQENKFWEDSFQVYEKGIGLFRYPQVEAIWHAYLKHFVDRYKGSKLERARDLFRQALEDAPSEKRKPLYLMYADYEEKHGLARHCLAVYEQATIHVPKEERREFYNLFVKKARALNGIPKVREVYEMAIESEPPHELPDNDVRELCMEFAAVEQGLGEIDRARAIWMHGSHLADPRRHQRFWEQWKAFEVRHGNEETFREMLRVQRSVAAAFSSLHFNTASVDPTAAGAIAVDAAGGAKRPRDDDDEDGDAMALLERSQPAIPGFVSAGIVQNSSNPASSSAPDAAVAAPAQAALDNPEDIDIDMDEDNDEDDDEDVAPSAAALQGSVPAGVFGNVDPETLEKYSKKSKVS